LAVKSKTAKSAKSTKATKSSTKKTLAKVKVTKTKQSGWKWGALLTLSLAMFVVVASTTILNLSIGQVSSSLGTTVASVQGTIAMYALVMAAFILPGARLGEIWGKKKVLSVGLILLAAGAITASYATNLLILVLGWSVIQGIGAALILPQAYGLLRSTYSNREQALSYGVIGGVIISSIAFGPVIGGLVTENWEWLTIFQATAALAALVLVMNFALIKGDSVVKNAKLDMNSVWLSATGMVLVVLGAVLSTKYGFIAPRQPLVLGEVEVAPFGLSIVVFMIGFGLLFSYLTWLRAKAGEAAKLPTLFKPSLFKNVELRSSLAVLVVQGLVLTGSLFVVALFMQSTLDLSSVDAAIGLLPLSASVLVVSFLALVLTRKVQTRGIVALGFLMIALGLVLIDVVVQAEVTATDLIPGLIVMGIGVGLIASQIHKLLLSSADKDSDVAGLTGTAQQLGVALGTAVVGTFVVIGLTFGFSNALEDQGVYDAQSRELLSTTVETDFNNLNDDELDALLSSVPLEVVEQIEGIKLEAEFNAIKTALGLLAVVAVIGFLVSLKLPAKKLA